VLTSLRASLGRAGCSRRASRSHRRRGPSGSRRHSPDWSGGGCRARLTFRWCARRPSRPIEVGQAKLAAEGLQSSPNRISYPFDQQRGGLTLRSTTTRDVRRIEPKAVLRTWVGGGASWFNSRSERDETNSRGESGGVGGGSRDGRGARALALDGDRTGMGKPERTDGGTGVSAHCCAGAPLAAGAAAGRRGDDRTRRRRRAALPPSPARANWGEVGADRGARVEPDTGRPPGRSARHRGAPHGRMAQGAPRARSGSLPGLPGTGRRTLPSGSGTGDRGGPGLRGTTLARGGASPGSDSLSRERLPGRPATESP